MSESVESTPVTDDEAYALAEGENEGVEVDPAAETTRRLETASEDF